MAKNTALAAYKAGLKTKSSGKHRKTKFTVPLAVVAGFVPLGLSIYNARDTGVAGIMNTISKRMTGYDTTTAKWSFSDMKCGTISILGGFLVHSLVGNKLGINRMIARAGIPILRI